MTNFALRHTIRVFVYLIVRFN